MYPHTKFGIPTSKNIGDMDRTRKRVGHTDGRTDGRTVRLLYASQSSFGGIKKLQECSVNASHTLFFIYLFIVFIKAVFNLHAVDVQFYELLA